MRKRAGMLISADMLNDNSIDEQASSGLILDDNYSFVAFLGRKIKGMTTISVKLEFVGTTITATAAGNIGDSFVGTLPVGWWPPESITGFFGKSDDSDGSFTILPSGNITLKTMNNNAEIESPNTINLSIMWISEND